MTYTPEQLRHKLIAELADEFCRWPLPQSVCSDACASNPSYPHPRTGTNLLTHDEAKQMFTALVQPILNAHADALEELARMKAPADGEIAEVVRKLRDWKQVRTKPMLLAHYFAAGCEAADILESLAARLAESEAKLNCTQMDRDHARKDAESALAESERRAERLKALLHSLHALVWGECPSLLNEDSGGSGHLDADIRAEFKEES